MASLGQLTAGIAHEIKNPLNFVNNFADLNVELLEELEESAAALDLSGDVADLIADITMNVRQIAKHGKRADTIVASMMDHATASKGLPEKIDIAAQLREYAGLTFASFRTRHPDFDCTVELPDESVEHEALVIPQELGRVWINIFNNAFDAVAERMAAGAEAYEGRVEVALADLEGDMPTVKVEIRDNGPGIEADKSAHVFEPFYTTKPTGMGNTGLGLSLTHDIVTKGHGGQLEVSETTGGGATFTVTIPVESPTLKSLVEPAAVDPS